MTVDKKIGRPTKYSDKLAEQIAENLTHSTIRDTCEKFNINTDTYYKWLYKYPDFSELSTKARKTKAVQHFHKCEEVLELIEQSYTNEEIRGDLLRLKLDFHLRLAGKANQGLFGDKQDLNVNNKEKVNVSFELTEM